MQLKACAYGKIFISKGELFFRVSHLFALFEMFSYHKQNYHKLEFNVIKLHLFCSAQLREAFWGFIGLSNFSLSAFYSTQKELISKHQKMFYTKIGLPVTRTTKMSSFSLIERCEFFPLFLIAFFHNLSLIGRCFMLRQVFLYLEL